MISGYIVGDREVVAGLQAMPAAVRASVKQRVQRLLYALQQRVQSRYLRGPRPTRLGVVTGRLINSIAQGGADSRTRMEETGGAIYGYVGTNVPYGAAWETGFERRVGAGARGGPRTLTGRARDSYFAKRPPGTKRYDGRPFLKPALDDMRPTIIRELGDALVEGAKGALA